MPRASDGIARQGAHAGRRDVAQKVGIDRAVDCFAYLRIRVHCLRRSRRCATAAAVAMSVLVITSLSASAACFDGLGHRVELTDAVDRVHRVTTQSAGIASGAGCRLSASA